MARNLNGWDDSDAGVTAYSFPPRKRAPGAQIRARICAPSAKMSTKVPIFAGYVPAYSFHPRKCAPCRSTDPELDSFVELSRPRAVAHAEVIIGVFFSFFLCNHSQARGCMSMH